MDINGRRLSSALMTAAKDGRGRDRIASRGEKLVRDRDRTRASRIEERARETGMERTVRERHRNTREEISRADRQRRAYSLAYSRVGCRRFCPQEVTHRRR